MRLIRVIVLQTLLLVGQSPSFAAAPPLDTVEPEKRTTRTLIPPQEELVIEIPPQCVIAGIRIVMLEYRIYALVGLTPTVQRMFYTGLYGVIYCMAAEAQK